MALTCRGSARISLAALGGHAAEAERLELAAHLASCERCSDQHGTTLGLVQGLRAIEPETLTPAARDLVSRMLAARRPARGASGALAQPRRWPLRLGVGLAFVAVAALVGVAGLVRGRVRAYRVVAGDVIVEPLAAPTGERAMLLRSVAGGEARIADATVSLAGATEVLWSVDRGRADLRRGKVTVDVEHRPGQQLEIRTERFTVTVVGTRFTVDAGGVHTERGAVRVARLDGSFIARVEAGNRWSVDALAARPATTPAVRAVVAPPPARVATAPVERVRTRVGGPPPESLGAARRALGRGDALAARRIVEPLFRLGREVAVEARIIFAESFLVEGRYADAIDGYRLVSRDFPSTVQAEISAFAIAQLESDHGNRSEAQAALQAYLARYPHGRFAREAGERLGQLGSRPR
jgi:ferric-dicitrate binding protein FerR (iron transport regulator)